MAKRVKINSDDGCAGCITASKARPCRVHGCTKWCGIHEAGFLTQDYLDKAYGPGKAKPEVRCAKCGHVLERDATKKRPFWICNNLLCEKNQKESVRLGNVIITNRPKK